MKQKGHDHFCCAATFSGSFKYETGEGRSVERGTSGFDGLQSGPKIQDGFIDFIEVCYPVQTAKKFMTVVLLPIMPLELTGSCEPITAKRHLQTSQDAQTM